MKSTLLAAGVCASLAVALLSLASPVEPCLVPGFRLSHAQTQWSRAYWKLADEPARTRRYDALIDQAARRRGLDARLLRAVIAAESGFDPEARSPRGAIGLMQVMPQTAKELGFHGRLTDPAVNIAVGAAYLAILRRVAAARYGAGAADDPHWLLGRVVAAYNAGPRALSGQDWCSQTRLYVQKVLFYYDIDQALGGNPPQVLTASAN